MANLVSIALAKFKMTRRTAKTRDNRGAFCDAYVTQWIFVFATVFGDQIWPFTKRIAKTKIKCVIFQRVPGSSLLPF